MKFLCLIDFSTASVDAARYAAGLASGYSEDGEMVLMHCVFSGIRSNLFASYGDYQALRSEKDLHNLRISLLAEYKQLHIRTTVARADPIDLVYPLLEMITLILWLLVPKALVQKIRRLWEFI